MFSWISNAVGKVASWLGDGIGSFFEWLFHGIGTVLTKLIDAASGFWDVLDALWNFAVGFQDTIFSMLTAFFPFLPAPVSAVISFGFLAILVAGIYKKVKK